MFCNFCFNLFLVTFKEFLCIPSLVSLEPQKSLRARTFSVFWIAYLFLHRFLHNWRMLELCGLKLGYRISKIKSSAEESTLVNDFFRKPQDRRQNSGIGTSNWLHRVRIVDNSWLSNQIIWTFKLIKQLQTVFFITVSTLNTKCPFRIPFNKLSFELSLQIFP